MVSSLLNRLTYADISRLCIKKENSKCRRMTNGFSSPQIKPWRMPTESEGTYMKRTRQQGDEANQNRKLPWVQWGEKTRWVKAARGPNWSLIICIYTSRSRVTREKMNLSSIVHLINEQNGRVIVLRDRQWNAIGEKRSDEFKSKIWSEENEYHLEERMKPMEELKKKSPDPTRRRFRRDIRLRWFWVSSQWTDWAWAQLEKEFARQILVVVSSSIE